MNLTSGAKARHFLCISVNLILNSLPLQYSQMSHVRRQNLKKSSDEPILTLFNFSFHSVEHSLIWIDLHLHWKKKGHWLVKKLTRGGNHNSESFISQSKSTQKCPCCNLYSFACIDKGPQPVHPTCIDYKAKTWTLMKRPIVSRPELLTVAASDLLYACSKRWIRNITT